MSRFFLELPIKCLKHPWVTAMSEQSRRVLNAVWRRGGGCACGLAGCRLSGVVEPWRLLQGLSPSTPGLQWLLRQNNEVGCHYLAEKNQPIIQDCPISKGAQYPASFGKREGVTAARNCLRALGFCLARSSAKSNGKSGVSWVHCVCASLRISSEPTIFCGKDTGKQPIIYPPLLRPSLSYAEG